MKQKQAIMTISVLMGLLVTCLSAAQQSRFAPAYDLNLKLAGPITRWDEALPLGNGMLGGLLWGQDSTLRLSLDRGDLWDLRTPQRFSEPDFTWREMKKLVDADDMATLRQRFDSFYEVFKYPTKLPGGRLEITLDPALKIERFELGLAEAMGQVHLTNGTQIRGFYSATKPVAFFIIPGTQPIDLKLIAPTAVGQLGYPAAQQGGQAGEVWYVQKSVGKLQYATYAACRQVNGQTLVALTIQASRDGSDPLSLARYIVQGVLNQGGDGMLSMLRAHQQYWRNFWSASRVRIPDLQHLRHYYLVQYLYGAASRTGAPSIPLQGVWTADSDQLPPWHGDYHHDLNTQMTYDAYQSAGRFTEGACFLDHMHRLLPRFRRFAQEFYESPGAAIPAVMTQEGDPMAGWVMYSLSPTNGAWVGWLFYKHWLYTRDTADLRRAYGFCTELGECLRHLLRPDAQGHLVLPLSSSPEIYDNTRRAFVKPNSNYDRDCMEALFRGLAHMARQMKAYEAVRLWSDLADKLGPRYVDEHHILMYAKDERMVHSHRHFSHSMALHPFDLMSIEGTDRDRQIIQATISQYDKLGTAQWCGYSFSWMACLRARVGDGDAALRYLDIYEKAFITRNGFHVNGDQLKAGYSNFQYRPFTLEGNFLAAQAVHEMLLQSWHDVIRVFPAIPAHWQQVGFEDLRAQGGFKVSARRTDGAMAWLRIKATQNATLRIFDNFKGQSVQWNRKDIMRQGSHLVVKMKRGDMLVGQFKP